MITGSIILSVVILAVAVWALLKVVKLRRKLFVLLVIAIVIFSYLSFNIALDGSKVDLTDFKGVTEASGVYFSWLSSSFGNVQTITSNAVENNSENSEAK